MLWVEVEEKNRLLLPSLLLILNDVGTGDHTDNKSFLLWNIFEILIRYTGALWKTNYRDNPATALGNKRVDSLSFLPLITPNPLIKPGSSPLNPELLILTLAEFLCLSGGSVTPAVPCWSLGRRLPLGETETSGTLLGRPRWTREHPPRQPCLNWVAYIPRSVTVCWLAKEQRNSYFPLRKVIT